MQDQTQQEKPLGSKGQTEVTPPPASPFTYKENKTQKALRVGGMLVSFVSMLVSLTAMIKNLFQKK